MLRDQALERTLVAGPCGAQQRVRSGGIGASHPKIMPQTQVILRRQGRTV